MAINSSQETRIGWLVRVTVVGFILIAIILLVLIVTPKDEVQDNPTILAADTYLDIVDSLLLDADSANGPEALAQFACATCHETGAAPAFDGLGTRAGERRPLLTAAAYIYEAIVAPHDFIVEGYGDVMPENLRDRMTDDQLGDIIAYLLEL